jgi:hypothetical protein
MDVSPVAAQALAAEARGDQVVVVDDIDAVRMPSGP